MIPDNVKQKQKHIKITEETFCEAATTDVFIESCDSSELINRLI